MRAIPKHENLPADFGQVKREPKMLEELKFFESATNTVTDKKMKHTRMHKGTKDSVVKQLFQERVGEVESLRRLCSVIK